MAKKLPKLTQPYGARIAAERGGKTERKKKCPRCGKMNFADQKTCSYCGAPLESKK